MREHDFLVIGAGIVGLATAMGLRERFPDADILVIDKEDAVARHQSGRNSGVIHSGIYYAPGSLKARLARDGAAQMRAFCRTHGLPHETCGKLIVATEPWELTAMEELARRAQANGVEAHRLTPGEVRGVEPHVHSIGALHVPSTGIIDFAAVARKMAELVRRDGGDIRLGTRATGIRAHRAHLEVQTDAGPLRTRFLVNCGGLHSDRIARLEKARTGMRIVPFRGEYYELVPASRGLVKNLVYPVPDPRFPFLGVHFTRDVHGGVHAGPNAVLAFKREGYRKRDFSLRDTVDALSYPAFWRFAAKHWREGGREWARSLSKRLFLRSLQRLVPEVQEQDLEPAEAGVRAQAMLAGGKLVDDFHIVAGERSIHVCNAPSPAATASIEIGRLLAAKVGRHMERTRGRENNESLCHGY